LLFFIFKTGGRFAVLVVVPNCSKETNYFTFKKAAASEAFKKAIVHSLFMQLPKKSGRFASVVVLISFPGAVSWPKGGRPKSRKKYRTFLFLVPRINRKHFPGAVSWPKGGRPNSRKGTERFYFWSPESTEKREHPKEFLEFER
jgi:hypothetical protein